MCTMSPRRPPAARMERATSAAQVSMSRRDRKSTRLNSSHLVISYAVFCLKKKNSRSSRRRFRCAPLLCCLSLFSASAPPKISTLSLHDALPISTQQLRAVMCAETPREQSVTIGNVHHVAAAPARGPDGARHQRRPGVDVAARSEEHTSELQSPCNLVCRLLLEKKKFTQ